jgi:mRNA-degrading endonuclease RelE of RelBE toxin-antitoxin system
MSFEVKTTHRFNRELKRLSKKYASLKNEFSSLLNLLTSNPIHGVDLGNNCYKIRLAIASKNKGKSGGARIISVVIHAEKEVVLVSIYDKGERDNLSENEIKGLINDAMEDQ